MFKRQFAMAVIFGAAALAPPAAAQSACLAREALTKQLSETYDEAPVGRGLQSASQLLEIWASKESGSYTVFITHADGRSCVVASGQNWSSAVTTAVVDGVLG